MPKGKYIRTEEIRKTMSKAHKGRMHTEEEKKKVSEKLKGRKPWNAGLVGVKPIGLSFKGCKHTQESIEKTRNFFLDKPKTQEHRDKISKSRIGKFIGEENNNWKGGITPLVFKIRTSFEYRQWRSDCFTRDNFTCQECGDNKGGNLEAHHIDFLSNIIHRNNIKDFNEARNCSEIWNINNGITLCIDCHKKKHYKHNL